MVRIVADDKIPFLKGALDRVAEVEYIPGAEISKSDLKNADCLITRTRTICNAGLLEGTKVRFIASATIGSDHIDAAYCKTNGITWTNAPGCNSSSVKQYLLSALFYLASLRQLELGELTLGIIGIGNVGSKVADAAKAMGMNVLQNDPPRQRREGITDFVELKEVLNKADVITLHVPLIKGGTDNTHQLVNWDFIQNMKQGSMLINTSRGGVVDEQALLKGISHGRLSNVVLDVFNNEPGINLEILNAITLGTPHIAGYSLDGKAQGTTMSVRAISHFFHLDLDHWAPGSIPVPENNVLMADASHGTAQDVIWELFRQTYDVTVDDGRLRNDPGTFERLRGDYPFRREPPAYSVRLSQGFRGITSKLEILGFSVLSDSSVTNEQIGKLK